MIDVAIIGGGITGLTLSYKLSEQGQTVSLFEKDSTVGGVIQSTQHVGCLVEDGPNSFALTEEIAAFLAEIGLEQEIQEPSASLKNRFIAGKSLLGHPVLYPVPGSITEGIFSGLISPLSKLRLLLEPLQPKSNTEDEDVYSFFVRRLGKSITEQVVEPALGGIWAADIRKLSLRSSLSKIRQLEQEHGSLLKALLNKHQLNKNPKTQSEGAVGAKFGRRITSFKKGLSQLPKTLSGKLTAEQLKTRHEVLSLEQLDGIFKITYKHEGYLGVTEAKNVVLATPSYISANLLAKIDSPLSQSLETIPYSPLGIVHFLAKKKRGDKFLNGFGALVQPSLEYATLGVIYASSLFPDRAPEKYHLLTAFVGGGRNPGLSDVRKPAIVERVASEIQKVLRLQQPLTPIKTRYYLQAIPSPLVGHFHILEQLRMVEDNNPGLHISGNWVGGASIGDRLGEALTLSEKISAKAANPKRSRASA